MDESEHWHHWENLHSANHNEILDMSFQTVCDEHNDAPKTAGKAIPLELLDDTGAVTTYADVTYHGKVGCLILSDHDIVFQPNDSEGESPPENQKHPHWRWKAIKKHQISPATSDKIMMKLISFKGDSRAVAFTFVNREQLNKIRKDVTLRLRPAKTNTNTDTTSTPSTTLEERPLKKVMKQSGETTALLGGPTTTQEQNNTILGCDRSAVMLPAAAVAVLLVFFLLATHGGPPAAAAKRMLRPSNV